VRGGGAGGRIAGVTASQGTRESRGLADSDPEWLGTAVVRAWSRFCEVAGEADLSRPSRLPGWTGRDVCVHLGSWEDHRPLESVVGSARAGGATTLPAPDAENEALLAAHHDAADAEVLDALRLARDAVAEFFAGPGPRELGRAPTSSAVGPLPVLSLVAAGTYELAVHALDLQPCGAPEPGPELLLPGLGSLIDVTGALAARRGLSAAAAAQTPDGGWRFDADGGGWTTTALPPGPLEGTAVLAPAALLLDVSAGRVAAAPLVVSGGLRLQGAPALLRLAPLIEDVPGIPGGPALRRAGTALAAGGRVAGRLPGVQGLLAGFTARPGRRR
jgi:uncharacterized protein (TIGR03083 family)